jgi:hypothetical protein
MNFGRIDLRKITPYKQQENETHHHFHLPVAWLISSILFFLISSVVAPVFWSQLDKVDKPANLTTLNIILGISGIIVYCLEPIIWHNNIYGVAEQKPVPVKLQPEKTEKNWFSFITGTIISLIVVLFIGMPAMVLAMFKPVLRAMILYVSLSFLHIGSGNTGEHPLFVIMVTADIFLYYIGMIAPNWKYNPVNVLVRLIKIKNEIAARYTAGILLIIHTALIYSLLLSMVYADINHHPEKLNLGNLALWWFILTLYSRMSFISNDIDVNVTLRNIPGRILLINLLALVISFIGFIWPFYFG